MKSHTVRIAGIFSRLLVIIAILTPALPVQFNASAQGNSAPVRVIRSIHTNEFGANDPKGLAFSPTADSFLILGSTDTTLVTRGEDNAGTLALPEVQADPLNAAFDKKSGSLFAFNRGKSELVKMQSDSRGLPNASASPTRYASDAYGLKDPQGIAFDPVIGRLFILDAADSQILAVVPHVTLGFDSNEAIKAKRVQKISLKQLGLGVLKGLAYNPGNGHLYITEPAQKKLHELTQ
ncbi:MAG TPA: hypothetical protein VN843_33365, partial [Anaerolineales bacterium]|nr:hypothetical protein [Anaerolineales bacterium]